MSSVAMIPTEAREAVRTEIEVIARTAEQPPELDDVQRLMPQANGDQDTW